MAAVRHHIRYSTKDDKGETRSERNKRFGFASPPDPMIPKRARYMWRWFWDLHSQRQHGMNGPQPLSFLEMKAWSEMTGTLLSSEEWSVIVALDRAYRDALADEREAQRESQKENKPA